MGLNTEKNIELSNQLAELMQVNLVKIDGLSTKKMFGGHGLFHESKMFGLIDSKGNCFLKANEENIELFTEAGGLQHSRMPYYSINLETINNEKKLILLTQHAIKISK